MCQVCSWWRLGCRQRGERRDHGTVKNWQRYRQEKGAAQGVSKENDRARKVLEKMKIGLVGLAITAVRMATGKPTLNIWMRKWR